MKRILLLIVLATIGISLLTCNESEITPRDYPRVRTLEVFNINQDGASFKGEIYFSSVEITDHGFLISESKNPTLGSSEKISLGSKSGIGEFTSIIMRSMITGKEYFVRAYVKSSNHTVYGDVISFTSLGSKATILKKVSPQEVTWQDTLYLIGENFSEQSGKMEVRLGGNNIYYKSISTDSIFIVIPLQMLEKTPDISIKFDNTISKIENAVTMHSPTITSVTPERVALGETITITGSNLNTTHSKVKINGLDAPIVSRTTTSIQVKIPTSLSLGTAEVFLYIGNELISNILEIEIEGLQVFGIEPTSGTFNDVIKINGDRFGTNKSSLGVFFGGYVVDIISLTDTEIQVQVPTTLNSNTASIEVHNNFNQQSTSPQSFSIRPPIVDKATNVVEEGINYTIIEGNDFWPGNANQIVEQMQVYLGNKRMNIISCTSTEIKVIRDFNSSLNSEEIKVVVVQNEAVNKPLVNFPWIESNDSYREYTAETISFEWPDEVYVGLGRIGSNSFSPRLWQYNPEDLSWTQLTEPSGLYRGRMSSFVYKEKGYVFGGVSVLNNWFQDYWSFDRITKIWKKEGDLPNIPDINWRGFQLNDVFYLLEVNKFTNESRLWSLDKLNNQWTLKYDLPFTYLYTKEISVNINNKHYLRADDHLWEYDSSLDLWSDLGAIPFMDNSHFYAKELNGNLFCVNTNTNEAYEYTPGTNSWTRRTFFQNGNYGFGSFSFGEKFYLHAGNSLYEYNPAFEN